MAAGKMSALRLQLFLAMAVVHSICLQSSAANSFSVDNKRVLLMPVGNESHFVEFHGLGRFLRQLGYEVHVLFGAPDAHLPAYASTTGYHVHEFNTSLTWITQRNEEAAIIQMKGSQADLVNAVQTKSQHYCRDLLQDEETFRRLRNQRYDVAIVDSLYIVRCYLLLVQRLGIRNVVMLGTAFESWRAREPLLASIMQPQMSIGKYFGWVELDWLFEDGSFAKRLLNTIGIVALDSWLYATDNLRQLDGPTVDSSSSSADRLVESLVSLHLVNRDHILDNNVYPEMPNVKLVGGIGYLPPQPLKGSLRSFADDAKNGLIVCTFGSMFSELTEDIRGRLLFAFANLTEYRIVVKLDPQLAARTLANLSNSATKHIVAMGRVPQNDLLAHGNTRLFITHSGNNGQFEALAHGVPMIAMYLYADQIDNADRVEKRQFGVKMNVHEFTPHELIAAVRSLMQNSTNRERIRRASRVFHSYPHPGERAAREVDRLVNFGPEYYRPMVGNSLSCLQFYNLDVSFVLASLLLLLLVGTFNVCSVMHSYITERLFKSVPLKLSEAYEKLNDWSHRDSMTASTSKECASSDSEPVLHNRELSVSRRGLELFEVD